MYSYQGRYTSCSNVGDSLGLEEVCGEGREVIRFGVKWYSKERNVNENV